MNRWMFVGNLDWHMPAADVAEHLRRLLATVPLSSDSARSIADAGLQAVDVVQFQEGKRKARDADKLHQGYALVRFERAAIVEVACRALDGRELGAGARASLSASVARKRVEKEDAQREQEEQRAKEKQAQLAARRAHNLGQKRRRVVRMEQELESIFGSLTSPGGRQALWHWRGLPPQGQAGPVTATEHAGHEAQSPSASLIDWDLMPAECDPTRVIGHAAKETAEAAAARALRKRVQVESFYVLLSQMLPPPVPEKDGASRSGKKTVVDFGCGSGNLALPLAALMPHVNFVGVDMNARSIEIMRGKAAAAGLDNVTCETARIEEYTGAYDVAVALHACGNATDMAMEHAVLNNAAYLMCPCCVGKLKFSLAGGTSTSSTPGTAAARVLPAVTHPRSSVSACGLCGACWLSCVIAVIALGICLRVRRLACTQACV